MSILLTFYFVMFVLTFYILYLPMSLAGGSSKIQVNQIDLLSGSLAIAVILGTLLQIMPTPESLCLSRLSHFLEWLHKVIERDFRIAIYTCTETCHTCVYGPTLECLEKRIKTNIGLANIIGRKGKQLITVKELAGVLQQGNNAATFLELAKLTHYPRIHSLQNVVRVMHCLSKIHTTIVRFQWIGIVFYFSAGWLFRWGLPRWLTLFWGSIVVILFRRRPRCMDHGLHNPMDYQMAELAKHRLIYGHTRWIRYAILDILYQQLNRPLVLNYTDSLPSFSFLPTLFQHYWTISKLSTDECSSARLLSSLSLHSLKMILLCKHVPFIPPYMLSSSFGFVDIWQTDTGKLNVCHLSMEKLFYELFALKDRGHANQDLLASPVDSLGNLLSKFFSPLGKVIIEEYELKILLNIATTAILSKPSEEAVNDQNVGFSSSSRSLQTDTDVIDDVEIPSELAKMLYKESMIVIGELEFFIEDEICSACLMWSPIP